MTEQKLNNCKKWNIEYILVQLKISILIDAISFENIEVENILENISFHGYF